MTLDRTLLLAVRAAVFIVPLLALVQTGEKDWLFGFLPPSHYAYVTWRGFLFRMIVEVMVGLWLILALRDPRYRPRFSWVLLTCKAFVAVVGLAALFGVDPANSFFGDFERMEGFVGLLHLLGYMAVAGTVLDRAALWRGMIAVFLAVCAVVCVDSVIQIVHALQKQAGDYAGKPFLQPVPESRMGTAYFRIDARIASPIYLAVYLLFHAFLSALVVVSSRNRGLRFAVAALGVWCVALLFFTGTRIGVAGLLGGGVTALCIAAFRHPSTSARGILKLAALGAAALVAVLVAVLLFDPPFLKGLVPARFVGERIALNFGERLAIWGIAWQGFLAHPLLGWGQENFHWVYDRFFDPVLYGPEIANWYDRPHNVVLSWLVEAGLLGMLAYLAILVAAYRAAWSGDLSLAQKCLLSGALTGYLLFNAAELDNLTSYIVFFSMLAFLHHKTARESLTAPANRGVAATTAVSVVVTAAVVAGISELNVRPLRAAIAAKTPVELDEQGGLRLTMEEALDGGPLGRIDMRELLAKVPAVIDQRLRPEAVALVTRELTAEVEAHPDKVRARFYLGRFLGRNGQAAAAIEHLEHARSLSPRRQVLMLILAEVYLAEGRKQDAAGMFRAFFDVTPDLWRGWVQCAVGAIWADDRELEDRMLGLLAERQGGGVFRPHPDIIDALMRNGRALDVVEHLEPVLEDWRGKRRAEEGSPFPVFLAPRYLAVARAYARLRRADDAVELLDELIRLDPPSAESARELQRQIRGG